ncbi:hypothetical protein [Bacillus salacetis]|uniref:hypothetical protein n=1 Tax=Bacillus salacetis TaxID=2315464 RepID=UPI001443D09E|nr:hypothetical protein [Bacillus salacetis]
MLTYRKEGDRNPLGAGRWSWTTEKRKDPVSGVRIGGLLLEIKKSRRAAAIR